jgi:hypothetical protein
VVFDEASLLRVLALELDLQVARLTELIDSGELTPADGEVLTALERYYDFDLALDGRTSLLLVTDPPPVQPSLDSIASGLDRGLADRIAGSDPAGMHRDFTQAFAGWQEDGVTSPDTLVRSWLGRIDELAVQRAAGPVPQGPDGKPIAEVYITPQGHDLRQLVSSFLVGAVSFSRAVDVHLDDDTSTASCPTPWPRTTGIWPLATLAPPTTSAPIPTRKPRAWAAARAGRPAITTRPAAAASTCASSTTTARPGSRPRPTWRTRTRIAPGLCSRPS